MVAHGTSTWFIVDPWTQYSSVVPWSEGAFSQVGVNLHIHGTIHKTANLGHMFGYEFQQPILDRIYNGYINSVAPLETERRMADPWAHASNVGACSSEENVFVLSREHDVTSENWGPGEY